MKYLYAACMIAGTVICLGMSTRPQLAFGGEWLLGIGIIAIGVWRVKEGEQAWKIIKKQLMKFINV